MSEEILSIDPATGITTYYHCDPDGTVTIRTEQDVSTLLRDNLFLRNERDSRSPYNDGLEPVASVPLNVYFDLKKRGIIDDPVALKKWLNDPDNRAFRTRDGVL